VGSSQLSLGLVFLAGMVSFLSPCVLPIVPAYLSLISGLSFEELQQDDSVRAARWRLFGSALAFIVGFSLVTVVVLGSAASLVVDLNPVWKDAIRWVGGIVVLIFALHLIGVFRINALFNERRFHLSGKRVGLLGALLIGVAFAFGWSPCIGPILSGVFTFAAGTAKASSVWGYFVAYSIGLAVPFMLTALFVNLFLGVMRKMTRHLRKVEIVSGVLLLCMGILLLSNQLTFLSQQGGFLLDFSNRVEGLLR
jgi:cytochrome c-type biogenesis protein